VDRDGDFRADQLKRQRGSARVHVARPERRPPARDGQQRHVNRPERVHLRKQVGITREVDPRAPLHDEPEAAAQRPERRPEPDVIGVDRPDPYLSHGRHVAGQHLARPAEATPGQERPGSARDQQTRVQPDLPQRGHVQVILVHVGDEHGVHRMIEVRAGDGMPPIECGDAVPQQRIGQDAGVVQVDQRRGVAQEPDPPREPFCLLTVHRRAVHPAAAPPA